jgi:MFS family permease
MMTAPLKIKSYRNLFLGQFFSDFGGFLDFIALNILIIYVWKLGPAYTAALLVIFAFPMVFIGPFTAVWVDRLPKKMVMLVCDIMRVLIAISLVAVSNVYVLYALVFLKVTFGSIFDPARQSMIRHTVPEEYLLQASSLSQILMNSVKIIAPAVGSALMLITKPETLFILEAIGFFISALFIFGIPKLNEEKSSKIQKDSTFLAELKEGFSYIQSNKLLGFSIFFLSSGMLIVFLQEALLTPWAKSMGFLQSELGFIIAANGFGMVVGAIMVGKWTFWKNRPLYMMLYSGIASGLFVALFGLGSLGILEMPKIAWTFVFLILGCAAAGAFVPFGFILQKETPPELMGRVSGASNSIINLSMFIGPVIGGFLATWFGSSFVFIGAGLMLTVYAFAVMLYINKKRIRFESNEIKQFI